VVTGWHVTSKEPVGGTVKIEKPASIPKTTEEGLRIRSRRGKRESNRGQYGKTIKRK